MSDTKALKTEEISISNKLVSSTPSKKEVNVGDTGNVVSHTSIQLQPLPSKIELQNTPATDVVPPVDDEYTKIDCSICLSKPKPEKRMQWLCVFCESCIRVRIEYQIDSKDKPTCPNWYTDFENLHQGDLMTDEYKGKLLRNLEHLKVDRDPNLHWCPKPDWNLFVQEKLKKRGKKQKSTWPCGFNFCINWQEAWHEKNSCRKNKDKGFMKFMRKPQIRRCPKCSSTIQKVDGWNHMTWYNWKYEFWWICGKEFTNTHFSGASSCLYAGEKGYEPFLLCLLLPLLVFLMGFAIPYEVWMMGKWLAKNVKCFWIIILPFIIIGLILGILLQVLLPFLYLYLSWMLLKVMVDKWRFKYSQK